MVIKEDAMMIVDNENMFAAKGEEYHEILRTSIVKTSSIKDRCEVFNILSSLSLTPGYKLGLRLAQEIGSAYYSKFYVYGENTEEDTDIMKYLYACPTEMGAWQVYLLLTSSTVMPIFWHGGYIRRKFIFNELDIKDVEAFEGKDISGLLNQNILQPSVEIRKIFKENENQDNGGKYEADIYCCYWNGWEGLVREHAKIIINNNRVVRYAIVGKFVIYEYDCGIFF
jgi:hypothetical protein